MSNLDFRTLIRLRAEAVVLLIAFLGVDAYSYVEDSYCPALTWTRKAALEAEEVAAIDCSDHGRAYTDGITVNGVPGCECHNCYSGPTCAVYNESCVGDAVVGDPLFLQRYWMHHRQNITAVVSGWHRPSYFIDKTFMSEELKKHIIRLHKAVGNAVVDGKYLVFGNGVTQLINGIVTSLSPDLTATPNAPIKKVVSSVPYYPVFRSQTNLFSHRAYEWKGNASDYVNTTTPQDFIELVTSPNNPDGYLRKAVIPGSLAVYDHVTYWPHYSPITHASDEDIMMFSLSKYTGHAGSRFGWAFIRNEDVYDKLTNYIAQNSEGVSRETQFRTLKIIKHIVQQIEENHGTKTDFNGFGHYTLSTRWTQLTKLISLSDRFSVQKMPSEEYCNYFKRNRKPSPAYAWLKCNWIEEENCVAVLENGKILAYGGAVFEESSRYARLSLIKTKDDFEQLMERLRVLVKAKRSTYQHNYSNANQECPINIEL